MPFIAFPLVCSFFLLCPGCGITCHHLIGYLVYATHPVHDKVVLLHRSVVCLSHALSCDLPHAFHVLVTCFVLWSSPVFHASVMRYIMLFSCAYYADWQVLVTRCSCCFKAGICYAPLLHFSLLCYASVACLLLCPMSFSNFLLVIFIYCIYIYIQ